MKVFTSILLATSLVAYINAQNGCSSSSTSDNFECDSGECVYDFDRCDTFTDCLDGSDEENCYSCPGFSCDNYRCVSSIYHCDGTDDCGDNSDEDGCLDVVGLAVGLVITFVFLFIVCPIVVVVLIWCCVAGTLGQVYHNYRSVPHTQVVTTTVPPPTSTVISSTTAAQQVPNILSAHPGHPTPAYAPQSYPMQQYPPPAGTGYPPQQPQQAAFPQQQPAAYPPSKY